MMQILVLVLLIVVSVKSLNIDLFTEPDTVDALILPSYLGLWYQMYADAIVIDTFEKDSFCATALYGNNGNATISVHNYAKIGSPTGSNYVIDGEAYNTDPTEPGQLMVKFYEGGSPFPAPYWILALGPLNFDNLYDYAIVSDNKSQFLFVLARNVDTFNKLYNDAVLATLNTLGFTGFKKPIPTYQGNDCIYE